MERKGFYVMLLVETKIQTEEYFHNQLGHGVTCLEVLPPSAGEAQSGVDMVTRERPDRWGIESMRFHRPNMVSCKIVIVHTRTPIACVYLPPLDNVKPPRRQGGMVKTLETYNPMPRALPPGKEIVTA